MVETDRIQGAAKNALVEASNCAIAPEGACPAYRAIKKLAVAGTSVTTDEVEAALNSCRSCPAMVNHTCRAFQLIKDSMQSSAA